MLAKKKHRESIERQLEVFRAEFGREPEANDPLKKALRFIEENYDNDAVFDCPRCATQTIAWAIAHPACPDCGHDSMLRGMVIVK
jgi:rubrerythrin